MSTPYSKIFNAFLSKINNFDKFELSTEVIEADLENILYSSLPYFRLPKISLDYDEDNKEFLENLNNNEIQIIASLMKREWYKRFISDSELLLQKYDTGDFEVKSQANHLKALATVQAENLDKECKKLMSNYNRVDRQGKLFDYEQLAGK